MMDSIVRVVGLKDEQVEEDMVDSTLTIDQPSEVVFQVVCP
jgi:hypothetical protein